VLPDGLHGCFVDHQDNVWIAGNGDAIVQKYSHNLRTLLLQIGEKGRFDSSDGTITGTPTNSSRTLLNRPADIAVDPDNGDVYIADGYGNRRVAVFDRLGTFLRQWGRQATTAEASAGLGGVFLQQVHGINLGRDGLVYVNDRKGDRIQVFTKTGTFVRNIWIDKGVGIDCEPCIGTAWDLAFSPDVRQTYIYNTDGEQEILWTLARASGARLAQFGQPGHMAGEFTFLHTVAVDSRGNLYTAETVDGRRIQKFTLVEAGALEAADGGAVN
jgi:DNA-binding beta-propeller fold protein YncE